MLQPFALNNAKPPQTIAILEMDSTATFQPATFQPATFHDAEEWPSMSTNLGTFDRARLQQEAAQVMASHHQIVGNWRASNRGVTSRLALLTINDVALSVFCGLMSIWILAIGFQPIGQRGAPFWWVPLLASFFGVAAVAALYEAIWSTPQTRRAEMRKQLRQTRAKLAKVQNRLAMLSE